MLYDMDPTNSLQTKRWSTQRTGFKVTPKGALYLEFSNARVFALRPDPARCWTASLSAPRWYSLKDPPLELGSRIREVRISEGARFPGIAEPAVARETPYFVRRRDNLRKLLAHIPVDEQDVLTRFALGTWALYRLLHRSPAALELCASEDGVRIAYLLAQAHALLPKGSTGQRRSLAFGRRLLRRKRREIVGLCGFPPTRSTLHALSRVPCGQLTGSLLVDLRSILNDDTRRQRAAHLPVLSGPIIKVIASPHLHRVSPSFLLTLPVSVGIDSIDVDGVVNLLRHAVSLAQELNRSVPVFQSHDQLKATHNELMEAARLQLKLRSVTLPKPPDLFTDEERAWVRPLDSLAAMVAEGVTMHHCLGTLADQRVRAEHGRFFAFALHHPVRLTLAVACDDFGTWHIYDLKGFANTVAPLDAWAWADGLVARWNRLHRGTAWTPVQMGRQLSILEGTELDNDLPF